MILGIRLRRLTTARHRFSGQFMRVERIDYDKRTCTAFYLGHMIQIRARNRSDRSHIAASCMCARRRFAQRSVPSFGVGPRDHSGHERR